MRSHPPYENKKENNSSFWNRGHLLNFSYIFPMKTEFKNCVIKKFGFCSCTTNNLVSDYIPLNVNDK